MVADAVDARTIPLQQLEPAPLEASDGCISRCHAIVRLYQEGGSYVADLLDVRNPERTDSNRATIRPLGNAGRGPPLAPGTCSTRSPCGSSTISLASRRTLLNSTPS
jgi:hypothetical protein